VVGNGTVTKAVGSIDRIRLRDLPVHKHVSERNDPVIFSSVIQMISSHCRGNQYLKYKLGFSEILVYPVAKDVLFKSNFAR
jgi:hypothetical protein